MIKKLRVLIADDDSRFLNFLNETLTGSGYEVITAHNGIEALEQAQAQEPDLCILDILMPRKDGFQTLKAIREYSSIPVIMLTSQKADVSKIRGLNLGADDYMIKPFNAEELLARLENVRRRSKSSTSDTADITRLGNMVIDFKKQSVRVEEEIVPLTLIEWQLLVELALNPGHLIEYEKMLGKVWGSEYIDDIQLLRTWISRLRRKLEKERGNIIIQTVRNTGYIMNVIPAANPDYSEI